MRNFQVKTLLLSHFLICLFIQVTASFAHAEYRAFLLKITQSSDVNTANSAAPNAPPIEPSFRLVKSNLDHLQYPFYYPLQQGESIQYIDTWMCRGHTGNMTQICKSPREIASENPEGSTATDQTAQSLESK